MSVSARPAHRAPRPAAGLAPALAAALAAGACAAFLPADAGAQRTRDRCRYFEDGREYPCEVRSTGARRTTVRRVVRGRDDHFDYAARRQVTLGVGVLQYDLAGRETIPTAVLRVDRRLSRLFRGELGLAYAFGDLPPTPGVSPAPTPDADGLVRAHVLAPSAGVTAELPTPVIRPYVGAAVGLFARVDNGDDFVRPSLAFPVGLRLALSPRVGLRAEARFRFDQMPSGASAPNRELTAGLSVGY